MIPIPCECYNPQWETLAEGIKRREDPLIAYEEVICLDCEHAWRWTWRVTGGIGYDVDVEVLQ